MLLRNYDNTVAALSLVGSNSDMAGKEGGTFGDGNLTVKTIEGSRYYISLSRAGFLPMSRLYPSERTSDQGYSWVILGSGSAPVTYDDYKLENGLSTSQIVGISSSGITGDFVYNEQNKTWTRTLSYDFQAKSDITISEIGVVYHLPLRYMYQYLLVYREVLDTPVSLTTGQYLRVSITTTVSANPNKPADVSATVETV